MFSTALAFAAALLGGAAGGGKTELFRGGRSQKPAITVTLGTAQYAHGYQRPDFVVASVVCAKGAHRNPQRNAKRKLVKRMGIRQFKIQRRAFEAAQGAI